MRRFVSKKGRGGQVVLFAILLFCLTALLTGCGGSSESPYVSIRGEGVAEEVRLTLEELKGLEEAIEETEYFSINSYGTREYTAFKGVWLWHVLTERAELREGAKTVRIIAEDGYTVEYTVEEIARDDYIDEQNPDTRLRILLAWEQDGREFDPNDGNPFRFVIGQKTPGDVNKPYWVSNVETIEID